MWFFFWYLWWFNFKHKPPQIRQCQTNLRLLTHRWHFGNPCRVRAIQEFGFVVVDVLNLDDELGLGFHRLVGEPVQRLGSKRVVGLLLAIQPLGSMNIPSVLINNENGTCPFAWQDVFDGTISFINIRVKLVKNSCEMRLTYKSVIDMEICKNNSNVRQQHMKFYCSWKDKRTCIVHSWKGYLECVSLHLRARQLHFFWYPASLPKEFYIIPKVRNLLSVLASFSHLPWQEQIVSKHVQPVSSIIFQAKGLVRAHE